MPSRNSINKPKDKILHRKKASSLGQKRASVRAKGGVHRNSTMHIASSTPNSLALSLYNQKQQEPVTGSTGKNPVTTQTLSQKRLLKLERNKKYAEARAKGKNNKKNDADADADMEIDDEIQKKLVNSVTMARNALWSLVENGQVDLINGTQVIGEGTTLGGF